MRHQFPANLAPSRNQLIGSTGGPIPESSGIAGMIANTHRALINAHVVLDEIEVALGGPVQQAESVCAAPPAPAGICGETHETLMGVTSILERLESVRALIGKP